jgi:hypothetical protein
MDSIVLPSSLNVSNISYSAPRTLDNGGRVVYMNLNRSPIVIQTPEMVAPYGVSNWNDDGKGPDKYTLDLSFKGKEVRDKLNEFFEKMVALDKKLVHDGVDNSMTWLKKKIASADVVEALYTPIVKYAKDKTTGEITDKYPPSMKLKLPYVNGVFQCEVYDTKRKQVNLKELIDNNTLKGAKVTAIIQCQGLWVAGGKYGCSWKVLQMRVSPPQTIKGYAFKEIEDDKVEDSDIEDDNVQPARVANNADDEEYIQSSDDELETSVRNRH